MERGSDGERVDVADRFELRRDIRFRTRVTGARWDEAAREWVVATDPGEPRVIMALFGFPAYVQRCEETAAAGYTGYEVG
ncbi:MAG: hypothetical protein ACK54X_04645 [Burkholderiales bacterium]|jgi:hypothetical protein